MAKCITDIIAEGITWETSLVAAPGKNARAYIGTGGACRFVVIAFDIEDQGFPPGTLGYEGTMTSEGTIRHLLRELAEQLYQDAENSAR